MRPTHRPAADHLDAAAARNGSASNPEADQTLADREQTLADIDQTGSDIDQTAADSDQAAAESDQAASDQDLVHGGDEVVHDVSRDIRDRNAQQRQHAAETRIDAASIRDEIADERDLRAAERDEAAAQHDRHLAAQLAGSLDDGRLLTGAEIVMRAAESRRLAAASRAAAREARERAAADREQAARDREQAARDRAAAAADRDALVSQLLIAETDGLTGTRTRSAGLMDLEHEIDRARRGSARLVAAYVDVVGLKAVNDSHGHAAGDAVLRRAVSAIRGHVRSYDLIIRIGGDEFLCALSGTSIEDARARFDAVQRALSAAPDPCAITVGFAALAPDDDTDTLIGRADSDLIRTNAR